VPRYGQRHLYDTVRNGPRRGGSRIGEIEAALASIDQAVALTERTGQRWNEADTHRARGEILLKRDPANTAPAEEAYLTAIAVARQQKARSFGLRAALSLAKLYQSTGRAADAHAVLAPARADPGVEGVRVHQRIRSFLQPVLVPPGG
jgi:predicted ATPase